VAVNIASARIDELAQHLARPTGENVETAVASLAISSVTVLETRIIPYSRYGEGAVREFDELTVNVNIITVPFEEEQARAAFGGFRRYGKG
jgi:uncharacterized protein with PIN domain